MESLICHSVDWAEDGNPLLALKVGNHQDFVMIPLHDEELQALTLVDGGTSADYTRFMEFTWNLTGSLGSRIHAVELHAGEDELLHAELVLDGPSGQVRLPVHTIDGLIFAHRADVPAWLVANESTQPIGQMVRTVGVADYCLGEMTRRPATFLPAMPADIELDSWPKAD